MVSLRMPSFELQGYPKNGCLWLDCQTWMLCVCLYAVVPGRLNKSEYSIPLGFVEQFKTMDTHKLLAILRGNMIIVDWNWGYTILRQSDKSF